MKSITLLAICLMVCSCALARKKSANHSSSVRSISSVESEKPKKNYPPDHLFKTKINMVVDLTARLANSKSKNKKAERLFISNQMNKIVQELKKDSLIFKKHKSEILPLLEGIMEGASSIKKGRDDEGIDRIHTVMTQYQVIYNTTDWTNPSKRKPKAKSNER